MRVRREKLDRLRESGVDPYPVAFPRTATTAEVREKYPHLEPGTETGEKVGVTGRVMLTRNTGKLCFATIRDGTGEIQIMLSLAKVGRGALDSWKRDVDLGDHVGVEGEVITSRRGELSVMADRFAITSKCLRPLPEKHAGLTDPEARVRQRYVDLIVNDEAREDGAAPQRHRPRRPATSGTTRGTSRSRPRCCSRSTAGRRRVRSRRTSTPTTWTSTSASRSSCTSSGSSSEASRRSSRSTGTSATRARTPRTTPSSRCWRPTRRTSTTTTWPS